jgi:hypothetical protein
MGGFPYWPGVGQGIVPATRSPTRVSPRSRNGSRRGEGSDLPPCPGSGTSPDIVEDLVLDERHYVCARCGPMMRHQNANPPAPAWRIGGSPKHEVCWYGSRRARGLFHEITCVGFVAP